jgi:hypothetical protein
MPNEGRTHMMRAPQHSRGLLQSNSSLSHENPEDRALRPIRKRVSPETGYIPEVHIARAVHQDDSGIAGNSPRFEVTIDFFGTTKHLALNLTPSLRTPCNFCLRYFPKPFENFLAFFVSLKRVEYLHPFEHPPAAVMLDFYHNNPTANAAFQFLNCLHSETSKNW